MTMTVVLMNDPRSRMELKYSRINIQGFLEAIGTERKHTAQRRTNGVCSRAQEQQKVKIRKVIVEFPIEEEMTSPRLVSGRKPRAKMAKTEGQVTPTVIHRRIVEMKMPKT